MFAYSQAFRRFRVHRLGGLRIGIGRGVLRAICVTAAPALVSLLLSQVAAAQRNSNSTAVVVQPGAPGQPSRTLPPSTRPTVPHLSQADVSFMQGMIMHHSQAVE